MTRIHIHSPPGEFIGQIRLRGHRLWETVDTRDSAESAMIRAVEAMSREHHRARVLWCSDYYDPVVVMKLSR